MRQLTELEEKRHIAQKELDSRVPQDLRNERGQFATPPALAVAMLKLARQVFGDRQNLRFLDPALGTGVFFYALQSVYGKEVVASALGFETSSEITAIASNLWRPLGLEIRETDFTRAEPEAPESKADLIVCNPPYVRHHHLSQRTKAVLKRTANELGFGLNGLAGLYTYFLLLSDRWLADDGGAVWIIPAEVLDVNYGIEVKKYLQHNVTTHIIHRFDPEDVQFEDALVTSVILVFRKTPPPPDHCIIFSTGSDLLKPSISKKVRCDELTPASKWGQLLNGRTPADLHAPAEPQRLGEFFTIKRGLATGANDFFIMSEQRAKELGLPAEFLHPILPSNRVIESPIIEGDDRGFPLGLPRRVLLDCDLPLEGIAQHYPKLHEYLKQGENEGISKRYLPNSRRPWYRQENRPPAPILCTYMGRRKENGRIFRFFRNRSQATAANVWLLLYPKPVCSALGSSPTLLDEVFDYLQTASDVELVGRVYGGGLNKIEPRELANLTLPDDLVGLIRKTKLCL